MVELLMRVVVRELGRVRWRARLLDRQLRWHGRKWRGRVRYRLQYRAMRREAGLDGEQSWYACWELALKAFDVVLESGDGEAQDRLQELFRPLTASEMTKTAVAMAVLVGPAPFMGGIEAGDVEVMRLTLAVHWAPEGRR